MQRTGADFSFIAGSTLFNSLDFCPHGCHCQWPGIWHQHV